MKIALPLYVTAMESGYSEDDSESELVIVRAVVYSDNICVHADSESEPESMVIAGSNQMNCPLRPKEIERLIDEQGPTGFVDAWSHWKRKNEQQNG